MGDYKAILRPALVLDEGVAKVPYRCSAGYLTVGVGHNLDNPMKSQLIDLILGEDIKDAEVLARQYFPNFDDLSDVRKAVVVNMAFNMGTRLAGFVNMREMVVRGHWSKAAQEMADSKWAKQVQKSRSERLIRQMREGKV